jgi:AAA+ ATPase superfamily predicted ATPase
MKTAYFVGREAEMARFKGLLSNRSANLIVVRCRRRIGKSRLLAEFRKEIKSYFFSGNPPEPKVTVHGRN